MLGLFKSFFKTKSEKDIIAVMPYVESAIKAYETISKLDNDSLRRKTQEFKQRIKEYISEEQEDIAKIEKLLEENPKFEIEEKEKYYDTIDQIKKTIKSKTDEVLLDILPEAFAVIKQAARIFTENDEVVVTANEYDRDLAARYSSIEIKGEQAFYKNVWLAGGNPVKWEMIHYDVQLIGGVVLHQGRIAEMATGEGKTLVATLPVYLNALTGKGVHLVTVNDYLAKRDSEWMGTLYQFLGLTVDCIDKHEPNSEERRQAYLADITFGTNSEFGFDYLRDNMARTYDDLVQRGHYYAIVDEVDSVLVDDARTPLIISGPTPKGDKQEFMEYKIVIDKIYNAQRNLVNSILVEAKRLINDKSKNENEKEGGVLLLRAYRGLPKSRPLIKFLSEPGIKVFLQKTENYYIAEQNKHMHIIDDELFFVIDEKQNSIELTDKGYDFLTQYTGDPKFFVLPDIGSEIVDLQRLNLDEKSFIEKRTEIYQDFALKSERVHTINQLLKAYTLFEKDVEYVIMDNKVKIVDEQTGRIMEGRRYSDGLHQAIEAKENVKVEAATQTYATITLQNYFRMYEKLAGMTGTAETEAGEFWGIYKLDCVVIPTNKPIVRKDREDLVYKTKKEKYNAIIAEIVDLVNNGRPVLVGTTSVEISELLSKMLTMRKIKHNVLNAKLHQREADIVAEAGKAGTVTIATNMAGRGTDIKLGPGVKDAGGLAIIGTERHESRRVDRQLRGRAGRQGDPGSSQFFVSLEDDLMRLFGSDRIAKAMDRFGLKEGEVIQHSMISKSIERAQRKVEENNYGIRKRLVEYDDVLNAQRKNFYSKRNNALYGEKLELDISYMVYEICESLLEDYHKGGDFEGFEIELIKIFKTASPFNAEDFAEKNINELLDIFYRDIYNKVNDKFDAIAANIYPFIDDVLNTKGHLYENALIPFTDGIKTINVICNLVKSYETKGREVVSSIQRYIIIAVMDESWKEHLREMDDLKQSVQSATYEQKDPLLVYKHEAFNMFKQMVLKVNRDIVYFLFNGKLGIKTPDEVKQAQRPQRTDMSKLKTGRSDGMGDAKKDEDRKAQPVRVDKKVGRNELCPCGSGKKYKQCHGK